MKLISPGLLLFTFLFTVELKAQELKLYNLYPYDKNDEETFGFVSFSESYPYSEHPDSMAVPPHLLGEPTEEEAEYTVLESGYRERFLERTGIDETDTLYAYNFERDSLAAFVIKDLDVVAYLNNYMTTGDWPFTQDYYHIGFGIDPDLLAGFGPYYNALVYVGKQNPFAQGQMKPLEWRLVEPTQFPKVTIDPETRRELVNYRHGKVHHASHGGFDYYMMELLTAENWEARHLVVVSQKSRAVVCNEVYFDGDGTYLTKLNYSIPEYQQAYDQQQWTGTLLKNKPPVVMGFASFSFGCDEIVFLAPKEKKLWTLCDNRH